MTITVSQLAQNTLKEILVQGSENILQGDEYKDFLALLNGWMATQKALGCDLGYVPATNIADTLVVVEGAEYPLQKVLATEFSTQFGGIVSPDLQMQSERAWNTLRVLGTTTPSSEYPSTLPCGTAQTFGGYYCANNADANE